MGCSDAMEEHLNQPEKEICICDGDAIVERKVTKGSSCLLNRTNTSFYKTHGSQWDRLICQKMQDMPKNREFPYGHQKSSSVRFGGGRKSLLPVWVPVCQTRPTNILHFKMRYLLLFVENMTTKCAHCSDSVAPLISQKRRTTAAHTKDHRRFI